MRLIRPLTTLMAISAILMVATNAFADPLPVADTFMLGVNKIHDNDGEVVYSFAGGVFTPVTPGTPLVPGDVLLATVQFTEPGTASKDPNPQFSYNGVQYNEFTGINLLQIASITASGTFQSNPAVSAFKYTFVAPTTAAWTALTGTTPVPGTTTELFNNTANGYTRTSGSQTTDIASAVSGTLVWNTGFTGTTNGDGTVNPNFAKGENWIAVAPATEAEFALISPTDSTFNSGLTLLTVGPGGVPLGLTGNNFPPGSPGQFTSTGAYSAATGLQTNMQVSGTLTTGTDDFGVASNTNFFIDVVPEPSSLVLLGLGSGLLGVGALRRRLFSARPA